MRTMRLSLAGTAILALLGGLGGAALAQTEPGYSTGGTWISLVQELCGPTTAGSRVDQPNGDYQVRDLGVTCAAPGDDPRFGRTMRFVLNEDCFAEGGCVNWGTIEQPGADGAWSGWFAGTEDPDANTYLTIVMTGSGDYEGLTHIRHATGPFSGPLDHAGVVFEGAPPPLLTTPQDEEQVSSEATDAQSVLFVGNSFTYFNDGVETHVKALVASEDEPRPFEVDAATMGGATLKRHYDMGRFVADSAVKKIASGEYDVVILQGDIPELTERSVDPFLEYAALFDGDIRAAGAETVLYMTWPYKRLGWVGLDDIVAAHRQVEAELGAPVAPVAVAMADALAERPDLAMLGPDAEHPSGAGTYLAAAVIYATLFDRSPEGLAYRAPGLSEDEAAFLQRVAWEAVQEWQEGSASQ